MKSLLCIPSIILLHCVLSSCGDINPENAPVRKTSTGAKVDLTGVSLTVENASIVEKENKKHEFNFTYTLTNTSGYNIEFPCLYSNLDYLIDVTLTDKDGEPIAAAKRPLWDLTMTQPRPIRIPVGKTTSKYPLPLAPNTLKPGDIVNARIRFHAPSRYDELRSSLDAPPITIVWPGTPAPKKP